MDQHWAYPPTVNSFHLNQTACLNLFAQLLRIPFMNQWTSMVDQVKQLAKKQNRSPFGETDPSATLENERS